MKIKVNLLIMLILACNFLSLSAEILRGEKGNIISYFDTQDDTRVTFDKETREYTIKKKENGKNVFSDYPKNELKDLAFKTFVTLEDEYFTKNSEENRKKLLAELLIPLGSKRKVSVLEAK